MKFLHILLLPLLSILLVNENQVIGKYYSSHLGESSIEKYSEKIDAKVANLINQGGDGAKGVQQPSKSLKIPGSGEWKSTRWNIGEAAVHKKHHNWHKIFGDKKPTLKEIDPYTSARWS